MCEGSIRTVERVLLRLIEEMMKEPTLARCWSPISYLFCRLLGTCAQVSLMYLTAGPIEMADVSQSARAVQSRC